MPRLEYVAPILCGADVTASILYYRERLGVEVMFCREGQGNPGVRLDARGRA